MHLFNEPVRDPKAEINAIRSALRNGVQVGLVERGFSPLPLRPTMQAEARGA